MVVVSHHSVSGSHLGVFGLFVVVLCVVAISLHSMGSCCFSSFCEW